MFADNGKISLRQIKRLLIFNIFGMASLLLPDILAGRRGVDGAVAILCGRFCTFLLLWLLGGGGKQLRGVYVSEFRGGCGE